jgi:hypothetical protein
VEINLLMNELAAITPITWLSLLNGLLLVVVLSGFFMMTRQHRMLRRLQVQMQLQTTRMAGPMTQIRAQSEKKYPSNWQHHGGARKIVNEDAENAAGITVEPIGETSMIPAKEDRAVSASPAEAARETEMSFRERIALAFAGKSTPIRKAPPDTVPAEPTASPAGGEKVALSGPQKLDGGMETRIPEAIAANRQDPVPTLPQPMTTMENLSEAEPLCGIFPIGTGESSTKGQEHLSAEEERLRVLMQGVRGKKVRPRGNPGRAQRFA